MWRRVDLVWTNVSEESIASIFRVEKSACGEPAGFSHADFSTLKMEAMRSSETSVHTRSSRRHIPEDGILLFTYLQRQIIAHLLPYFHHETT
jgi:hypothetical protein